MGVCCMEFFDYHLDLMFVHFSNCAPVSSGFQFDVSPFDWAYSDGIMAVVIVWLSEWNPVRVVLLRIVINHFSVTYLVLYALWIRFISFKSCFSLTTEILLIIFDRSFNLSEIISARKAFFLLKFYFVM